MVPVVVEDGAEVRSGQGSHDDLGKGKLYG
jgi:hypothetical protein